MRCEEVNVCENVPSPCRNGGTCKKNFNSYECICPPGFGGKQCTLSVNNCGRSNPCQHGGICQNVPETGGVRCDCPSGYTGQFCQADVNECTVNGINPCENGAECQNYVSIMSQIYFIIFDSTSFSTLTRTLKEIQFLTILIFPIPGR